MKGFKQVHGAQILQNLFGTVKHCHSEHAYNELMPIRSDVFIQVLNYFSILSGSYDNTVRIWTTTGAPLLTIPGHSAPVKCVKWLSGGKFLKAKYQFRILIHMSNNTLRPFVV